MSDDKTPTHTAFALKREGRRHARWLEIGTGKQEGSGVIHVKLHSTPLGGFDGYVYLAPIGSKPPEVEPSRPAQPTEDEEI